jgi:hypothetical protein
VTNLVTCPWCGAEVRAEEYQNHLTKCPNAPAFLKIKQAPTILSVAELKERVQTLPPAEVLRIAYNKNANIIQFQVDSAGNIVYPLGKSPTKVYEVCTGGRATDHSCIAKILSDLYEGEQIAYTQYAEALKIEGLKKYWPDVLHIQGEELEHMQILAKDLRDLSLKY